MKNELTGASHRTGFWSGALFGMVTGIVSLLAYQYFHGILRSPRLISKAIFSSEEKFETKEAVAMFIATENLKSGILPRRLTHTMSKDILHAGYRNFRESWARDFSFAAYGLLALEQNQVVEDTLEAFLWFQKTDGQLPVKLFSMDVVTRFFHSLFGREQPTENMLRPKYFSAHGAPALDGQALLVIAGLNYVQATEDIIFLRKYWEQLVLAIKWLDGYRRDPSSPLLVQGAFADWADSVARRGRVLYTNVVYWKALCDMSQAALTLNRKDEAQRYEMDAGEVSSAIQEHFWRPDLGYFVTSEFLEQLSSDGNLLAIAWGLAQPDQAESILQVMKGAKMAEPVPTRAAYPAYPAELIALENHLGGLSNYHTTAAWLWLGAWHVISLVKAGNLEEAHELLLRISDVIVRDQQVNEVHGPNGEPLASLWYHFESPLIWNAGMVIYAYHIFETRAAKSGLLVLVSKNRK